MIKRIKVIIAVFKKLSSGLMYVATITVAKITPFGFKNWNINVSKKEMGAFTTLSSSDLEKEIL